MHVDICIGITQIDICIDPWETELNETGEVFDGINLILVFERFATSRSRGSCGDFLPNGREVRSL